MPAAGGGGCDRRAGGAVAVAGGRRKSAGGRAGPGRRDGVPAMTDHPPDHLTLENEELRQEVRTAREAADITAQLVVEQFEETERILALFQAANAQREAVLNA